MSPTNCKVNEWACRSFCASGQLDDLIQRHSPSTIAYAWQSTNRDKSCVESLYGIIPYCITQDNQNTYDSLSFILRKNMTVPHSNTEQLSHLRSSRHLVRHCAKRLAYSHWRCGGHYNVTYWIPLGSNSSTYGYVNSLLARYEK